MFALTVLSGCAVDERLDRSSAQVPHRLSWTERLERIQDDRAPLLCPNLPVTESKELLRLVDEIDQRTVRIKTVGARLKVKVTNEKGKTMNLDASYVGDASGNFRLRLTGIFGILGLDMAMVEDRLLCYLPTRKSAFSVPSREMRDCASVELGLIAELGRARELFSPRAWSANADGRKICEDDQQLCVNVLRVTPASTRCIRHLTLNAAQKNITSADVFRENGDFLGRAEYLKFVPYRNVMDDHGKTSPPDELLDTPVPQSVRLACANGKLILEFEVESLRLNEPIAEEALDLDIPAKIHVATLAETLASGKGLFEP